MLTNSSIQQPTFKIASEIQERAWVDSQNPRSHWGQWNTYINQLCLQTFLPWVQSEINPQASVLFQDWAHRNGSAISIGQKRLVLLPTLSIDMSEIEVPQLWVDDAFHSGDYYLAIQVDPDELWLKIWGYTTHRHLKAIGDYHTHDRFYSLETEHLISDINVLIVVQHLCPNEPTRFVA